MRAAIATRRILLILYILATPVLGIIGLITSPHKEIYPFFSWFLFALTPSYKTSYQIHIHATRDIALPTPLPYTQAQGYVPTPQAITVRELTQRLGKAIEKGDLHTQGIVRGLLERHHLYPGTTYSIHRAEYDPLLVWQKKQEPITELIAIFNHSHP